MAGNKKITELAAIPNPVSGEVYIAKDSTDYKVAAGAANGLATLDGTGKVPSSQLPASSGGGTWGSITGTLSNQTDLQAALNAKQAAGSYAAAVHTHSGADITSGTVAQARLGAGTADSTTFLRGDGTWAIPSVPAGSVAWGAITGTLSTQTDLQNALNAKSNTGHTHAASEIVSGTFAAARMGVGTADSTTFLRGDGTWAVPPSGGGGGGTVTSVNVTSSTGLSFTGGPITSSGTITMGGTLGIASGGTGATTAGAARTNLGAAAASHTHPIADIVNLQTTLDGKASTSHTHTFSDISGTLAIANGGTGATTVAGARTNFGLATNNDVQFGSVNAGGSALLYTADANTLGLRSGNSTFGFFSFNNTGGFLNGVQLVDANSSLLDSRYYTETEVNTLLDAKANLSGATFSGGVTAPSFTVSSDRRIKKDITDLMYTGDIVERLRPVRYTLIASNVPTYGFIAQEVEELIPEAVVEHNGVKSIDYAPIVAFLTEKVQDLIARVEELEAR